MKMYYFASIDIYQRRKQGVGHEKAGFYSGVTEVDGPHEPMDVVDKLRDEISSKYDTTSNMLHFIQFNRV